LILLIKISIFGFYFNGLFVSRSFVRLFGSVRLFIVRWFVCSVPFVCSLCVRSFVRFRSCVHCAFVRLFGSVREFFVRSFARAYMFALLFVCSFIIFVY